VKATLAIQLESSFVLTANVSTILSLQKALAFAIDHMTLASDDPIRPLSEVFLKLVKDMENSESLLGALGTRMDLSELQVAARAREEKARIRREMEEGQKPFNPAPGSASEFDVDATDKEKEEGAT
jgi:hypothetical protein